MLIPSALMQSMASFVSQNIGAGNRKRAKQSMFTGIGVGLIFGCIVFVLVLLKGDLLAGIFSAEEAVVQNAFAYLKGFAPETILTAVLFSMIGYFNGNSQTLWVMLPGALPDTAGPPASCLLYEYPTGRKPDQYRSVRPHRNRIRHCIEHNLLYLHRKESFKETLTIVFLCDINLL